jgi:hypothetical protein
MHNFASLAADLAPLFKKSGDGGDTGDRSDNHLDLHDFGVTTRRSGVSPVGQRVVTSPESSGDAKSERPQPLNRGVTTVTSVTTGFEQGAADALPVDCPEWQAICEELKRSEPPAWASAERWRELVADAESFLAAWGKTADRLGWTTLDLFGVHPTAPAARFDVMGLILILRGKSVSGLAERTATIDCKSGAKQTLNRPNGAGAVLITGVLDYEAPSICDEVGNCRPGLIF